MDKSLPADIMPIGSSISKLIIHLSPQESRELASHLHLCYYSLPEPDGPQSIARHMRYHDTAHSVAAPVNANTSFAIPPTTFLIALDLVTCCGVVAAAAAAPAAFFVEFALDIPDGPTALLLPTVTVAKAVAVPPPKTLACVTVAVATPPPAPVTVFVDVIEEAETEEEEEERTESAMGMAATTPPETS
ncbi:hypothetical protein BD289DRAFT_113130 [Coniella lustricola]|uniref:Uncharacterized protein n=1 Tax=Coniella lustricola TaxID=2025994 RepID=A0A2T3AGC3_9PEZI|nr:hypothetical protein BD289DRAFT_113130 [Coniella lustricola]